MFPLLDLPAVDLVVYPRSRPKSTVGIGGRSFGAHRAMIWIDPVNESLQCDCERRLASAIAHELHHCVRYAKGHRRTTLEDNVIAEGLACQFEKEVSGEPPFYMELFPDDINRYLPRYRLDRLARQFDYSAWFRGSCPEVLPKYVGYAIGYDLVGKHIQRTGIPASRLANTLANEFDADA